MKFEQDEEVVYKKEIYKIEWVGIDGFYVINNKKNSIRVSGKALTKVNKK